MSEWKSQQQRIEKQHRKLIRSPEKVSPAKYCENQVSPGKNELQSNIFCTNAQETTAATCPSLPLSPSTTVLFRKPSITIKYSKNEDNSLKTSTPLVYHQSNIDSSHSLTNTISTRKSTDQTSNNFLINVNSTPGCCFQINTNFASCNNLQSLEKQSNTLSSLSLKDEFSGSKIPSTSDTSQQQDHTFSHSPVAESLNLSLMGQFNVNPKEFHDVTVGQMVFNSNNPFLNDTLEAIQDDESSGKFSATFFNIDALEETGTTIFSEEIAISDCDDQLLKNKREKFSNASKICLVVSPPTSKLFQVSFDILSSHVLKKVLNCLATLSTRVNFFMHSNRQL